MSQFKIRHITRYLYENPVRDSANQIILYPIQDEYQELLQHKIAITRSPAVELHEDYFGNQVGTFTHSQPHQELVIDSQLAVVTRQHPVPGDDRPAEEQWKALEPLRRQVPYIDFLKVDPFESVNEIAEMVREKLKKNPTPLVLSRDYLKTIYGDFVYRKGITTVETTIDEIWKLKSGVCQDFAHILLVLLRLSGIPARYVSGYICPHKNGMRGEGATHAWVEAYIPFYGWLGLDPTNNCLVNESHVRLAVGKNFSDCSPVKGTYRGDSNHTLEVAVSVEYEDGKITEADKELAVPEPVTSYSKNSYRRHQEMQMQQ